MYLLLLEVFIIISELSKEYLKIFCISLIETKNLERMYKISRYFLMFSVFITNKKSFSCKNNISLQFNHTFIKCSSSFYHNYCQLLFFVLFLLCLKTTNNTTQPELASAFMIHTSFLVLSALYTQIVTEAIV